MTILFADIVGSTAMGEASDPEDLAELINGAFAVMNRAVAEAGGHVARLMGDGLLAFFGAPVSHEDDPLRAIRAALGIRDGIRAYGAGPEGGDGVDLAVRVGINSGLVLVGQVGSAVFSEYTTLGDAANTAARLQGAAPPGEILISEDTARLIRDAVALEPFGPLTLKGKRSPVAAFRVAGAAPAIGSSVRGLPGVDSPLVGRAGERARLMAAFEDALESRQLGWITVTGDAGVGKSRLLAAFLADLGAYDTPPLVCAARAVEQRADAYALIRSLLGQRYGLDPAASSGEDREALAGALAADLARVPGLGAGRAARDLAQLVLPDPAAEEDPRALAERALAALESLVEAWSQRGPLVLALEDLHWADDASLDAVARIAARLARRPAFIVGNARPALFIRRPHWGEGEHLHHRLDLSPLTRAAIGRLVAALVEAGGASAPPAPEKSPSGAMEGDVAEGIPDSVIDFVVERSEGNPYYVEELVHMLQLRGLLRREAEGWRVDIAQLEADPIPTTLQGMLQARLDALPPGLRSGLQAASVLGREFWDGALAALGHADPVLVAGLRAQGLIFARERSSFAGQREFVFKHALLRDAAYGLLLRRERPPLHDRAARWMLDHAGDRYGELAARIGWHTEAAGRPLDAAPHYLAAAERARLRYANADAIDLYGRALNLLPADAPERAEGLLGRELALDMLGRRDEQRADLDAMAALAGDDACLRSRIHFRRSWLALRTGDAAAAEVEARRALDLAGEDPAARADALVNLGNALRRLERPAEALDCFGTALALREASGDERGAGVALLGWSSTREDAGELEAAIEGYGRALAIFGRLDDVFNQAATLTNLAIAHARGGDFAAAEPRFETALDLYRSTGDRAGEGKALHNLGFLAAEEGDLALAEARLEHARAIFHQVGHRGDEAGVLRDLADVLERGGRLDDAAARRQEAASREENG